MFKEPISEWSIERVHFVSWLMFYCNLKNIPDGAPSEDIIQNDVLLDRWLKKYNLQKQAERTGSRKTREAKMHKHVIQFNKNEE